MRHRVIVIQQQAEFRRVFFAHQMKEFMIFFRARSHHNQAGGLPNDFFGDFRQQIRPFFLAERRNHADNRRIVGRRQAKGVQQIRFADRLAAHRDRRVGLGDFFVRRRIPRRVIHAVHHAV